MPITASCPQCPAKMRLPDSAAGKAVRCPKCGARIEPSRQSPDELPASKSAAPKKGTAAAKADRPAAAAGKSKPTSESSRKHKRLVPTFSLDELDELLDEAGVDAGFAENIEKELKDDERIVWVGRPDGKVAGLRSLVWVFVFIGIVIVINVGTLLSGSLPPDADWMKVFLPVASGVAGVLAFPAMMLYAAREAKKHCYVITDQRCLSFARQGAFGLGSSVNRYLPGEMREMYVKDNFFLSGAGSIVFYNEVQHSGSNVKRVAYGFLDLREPDKVETLIRRALQV